MRHVFAAIVMVLLLVPARAEALAWNWIKELSGPGPSQKTGGVLLTLCAIEPLRRTASTVNTTPGISKVPCIFADIRSFENADDDNFPNRVVIQSWDFGLTWKARKAGFELGAGLGVMRFKSDDRISNSGQMTRTKVAITLARGVVAPIRVFWPNATDWRSGRFAHMVKGYAHVNMITGTIDPTDFGVRAGSGVGESDWKGARNELVTSFGVFLDLGELILR